MLDAAGSDLYNTKKKGTALTSDVRCRLCGKAPASVAHVFAWYSALAQAKYLQRHNVALKILILEMLHDLDLMDSAPPWYSQTEPKPVCKSTEACAHWDVPVYADHVMVSANRVDPRVVDHKRKVIKIIEMNISRGWIIELWKIGRRQRSPPSRAWTEETVPRLLHRTV